MPFWFIVAIIFAGFGVIGWAALPIAKEEESKGAAVAVGIVGVALGIVFTLVSSANTVPIRTVGVVTSFGKPTGEVTGSGFKWVAPWNKVGEWPANKQIWDHTGDGNNRIQVRTATLADAWVHVMVTWKVRGEKAPEQFLDNKGEFERFEGQMDKQFRSAVNDAFVKYDPLADTDPKTGAIKAPDLKPFAEGPDSVKDLLTRRVGNDVEILSVTILRVDNSKVTDDNIANFAAKVAEGRNLDQDKINADKRKLITEKNAQVDKQSRCMEIAEKNGTDPGMCFIGGGASSVIVDSRKK